MTETDEPLAPPQSPPTTPGALGRRVNLPLSRVAIWAVVCGAVGLLITPFAIAGIVVGIMALKRLSHQRGERQGHGLAVAGIVTGGLGLLMGVFYVFMFWGVFQALDVARSSVASLKMTAVHQHAVAYAKANEASYPAHMALLATVQNDPVPVYTMVHERFRKSRRNRVMVGGYDFADYDDSFKADQAIIAAVDTLDSSAPWYRFGTVDFVRLPRPTNDPNIIFCWRTNPDSGAFVVVKDDGTTTAGVGAEDWAAVWQADAAAREFNGLEPIEPPEVPERRGE